MELLNKIDSPADLKKLPVEQLPQIASELRAFILDTVSKLGGHLGSSLGATEITIALHYAFDTPKDRLVWDTGHQTYGHKVLTGRRGRMSTIRQFGGLSGFLKRSESEYDAFGAGHASTAISAALGMAVARDLKGEKNKVVAIVSDGCMTGGESYEGLQNAGQVQTDLIVVLNDNQMFISSRVGALGAFLSKLLTLGAVRNAEHSIKTFLARFQFWGGSILRVAKRAKVLLFPGMLFEEMGFSYFGPVDGHDVEQLAQVFKHVKQLKGPVLVHCVTKKGKGYPQAEADPYTWHGPGKFDVATGQFLKAPVSKTPPPAYTAVFSQALLREAEADPRIIGITAAMPEGTGLDALRDRFPRRYFDVGLAEGHCVTFAAGLACEGYKPVVAVYSSFIQRAYDQVEHDVCLQKLPVILCLDRAGLVGEDGPTHHGVFDFSLLRMLPGMTVMAPADENELQHMLRTALRFDGPVSIRYPRGSGVGVAMDAQAKELPIGKGVRLKDGCDVTILAVGNRVHPALEASQLLEDQGISCGVVNMRFVKPLDVELLKECASKTPRLVTVEDNALQGGFGSAVLEALTPGRAEVLRLGIADHFVEHGAPHLLYDALGLSADKIAQRVAAWVPGKSRTLI
ncbi:MAG: 1-deoxy-D-xylulose-5-phosphate synthase [Elusimicrobia bacterium GWC2_65_9]|nr:MAG: 1-deoxy-D-xylulose-5-phosphate synthase [Elusimicrobia bacterium GWA2_66_18]OGR70687.1 MAG: 1-deoxy-D-xylulose-5-phosphate synthase [Elusimicrobia bacterium GWC2_65_9]